MAKTAPKLSTEGEALVIAIAKANGHPSPLDFAAKVRAEYEAGVDADPVSQDSVQIADEAHAAVEEVRQEGT